ncbi:TPA: protein TraD, partial [Escherichia coli]
MKLQYRIPLAIYSVWCIIAILLCKDGLYQMNIWTLVEILGMIALPLLVRPFFIL